MNALGTSLIVCGVAFLFSGLIFLLPGPSRRKHAAQQESFKQSQEQTEYYLQQMREERHER
jgi:hypothetical protein